MAETPQFVLYEHSAGYALFRIKEFDEIGQIIPEVQAAVTDVARFGSVAKLLAFDPFRNTESALDNCNCISEGLVHSDLLSFLEQHLPPEKKKKPPPSLGVNDARLASSIVESLPHVKCQFTGVVPELLRGIRTHFATLAKGLPHRSLDKAQLSLGHSYSRGKVKFDIHRVDNMVIQSIALLDQLDKDINTFGMRIREWYSYHFPELYKIVPEPYKYVQCTRLIMDRKSIDNSTVHKLNELLGDGDAKGEMIVEAARTSMGMDISVIDLLNIERFADRVLSLSEYRSRLHFYITDRMNACAPSLTALIGEQVGARLISHAGSLTNLAKYPASTVQILGAEKALFRALKTKSNTPKYGLLFHSSFIGRASAKNKGRISRFLANKCSIASRIDCFTEIPVASFGSHLKQQVEDRLKYFETGQVPKKNLDVMKEATVVAEEEQNKVLKKRKKQAKKARKSQESAVKSEEAEIPSETKLGKKRKLEPEEEASEQVQEVDAKKKKKSKSKKSE